MAQDFTLPDPLRLGVVTLSIYLTELQDCVNIKRAELGQSPISTFVSQKVGDTMTLPAINQLKILINQLALDFGYTGGVENVSLLGRPYVENPRVINLPADNFPIINDLRRVLKLITESSPIITLESEDFWGNYKAMPEPFGLMEQTSTVETGPLEQGPQIGHGLMTFFTSPSEIIEVAGVELDTKLRSWVINRFTGEVEFQTQETNLKKVTGVTCDDEFVYYLASETDNSISVHKLLKNDRTVIVSSITVQSPISEFNAVTGEGFPHYSFGDIFNDEGNIYLTGVKYIDAKAQTGSSWSGPSGVDDFEKYSAGAVAVISKGGSISFKTFEEQFLIGSLVVGTHATVPWNKMTLGNGSVDDNYIYSRYQVDTRWRQLRTDNDAFGYTFVGSTDPREIVGEENLSNGMVWVAFGLPTATWDEFLMKYEALVLRWVKPIGFPTGSWISHFLPHSNWLEQKSQISTHVVRISKSSFNIEVLETQILVAAGAGFTSVGDKLYIRLGNLIRVLDKDSGSFIGNGVTGLAGDFNIKSVEDYTVTNPELNPPFLTNFNPAIIAFNVPVSTNISVRVEDDTGVYGPSIKLFIQDIEVTPTAITPVGTGFDILYDPPVDFNFEEFVDVRVEARDLAGNKMVDGWTFQVAPEN